MDFVLAIWKRLNFLVVVSFLQLVVLFAMFFDVAIIRQILGFFYLTFLPGFIIFKLLGLNKFDSIEIIVFSVGFSVAFLMLVGLLINGFYLLLGILSPLSFLPLVVVLSVFIFIGGILISRTNQDHFSMFKKLKLSPLLPLFLIPSVLSVIGAIHVNAYRDNVILLFMIISVALLFIVGVLAEKHLPLKIYPFALFVVAISLLFHSSLVSRYVYTGDIHMEYFIFKNTENNGYWDPVFKNSGTVYGRMNSMLSITILPTIYSVMLNIEATWLFKIVYPLIFSFVPLTLYKLWQRSIGGRKAFIAAFLFMATSTFYTEMLGLNRQMIAELFFALLLLVVSRKDVSSFQRAICFVVFSMALITSHYALAEIFLMFIFITWLSLRITNQSNRNITATLVAYFFVAMFSWYLYTSSSATFNSLVSYGSYVYSQLSEFFNLASREQTVLRGLGLEAPPTIWNMLSRIFAYFTEFFILVGFISIIMKRTNNHFKKEYFTFIVIAMVFLGALIAVPGLANLMNMTRFYHLLLFFLAPLYAIGGEAIARLVLKKRREFYASILLLVILVPYFLFQTGFIYEVVKVQSWSVPLSKYRMNNVILMRTLAYVNGWKASGAMWLDKHINLDGKSIYADVSAHELTSYGSLPSTQRTILSNITRPLSSGVIYLSYLNVIEGVIVSRSYVFNITELSCIYDYDMDKVYSNGGCEIYRLTTCNQSG